MGGWGVHELTNKERFPSPILNFESPLTKFLFACVPWETTAFQLDIFYKKKQHIDENNV